MSGTKKTDTKKLVFSGLFTALICGLTMFPMIPSGLGYIHLGDAVIIISVFLIGAYAVLPAALGSALADIITGFAAFSPATFFIKGLMAFILYVVLKSGDTGLKIILCGFFIESIMVFGYLLYNTLFFGLPASLVSAMFDLIQLTASVIIGYVFYAVLKKARIKEKLRLSGGKENEL